MVYRYTKNKRFLDFAQKVTDIYLKRLHETSDDMVPIWDMDDSRGIAAYRNRHRQNKMSWSSQSDHKSEWLRASIIVSLCFLLLLRIKIVNMFFE